MPADADLGVDADLAKALAGLQAKAASPAAIAEAQRRESSEKVAELRRAMNAPRRATQFLRNSWKDGEDLSKPWNRTLKRAVQLLDAPGGQTVAFVGAEATGKTTLAVALMREATSRRIRALYMTRPGFGSEMRDARGNSEEVKTIKELVSYPLLVIDHVDEHGDTPWESNQMLDLINARHDAEYHTVLIASCAPEALVDAMGSIGVKVMSRINASGGVYHFGWPAFGGAK